MHVRVVQPEDARLGKLLIVESLTLKVGRRLVRQTAL